MVYLSGSFLTLVDLETALLQKIGATCVAAYNAKSMVESLRNTSFLAMDARHCAGTDMADLMAYGASVAAVGLAGGTGLPTTVIPFLLRGVNLLGIDSVMQPFENRKLAWARIANDLPMDKLEGMITAATLADLPALGKDILRGQVQGRVVVDVNA